MNLDQELDNMSEDELLDLAVQLYDQAKAKIAGGDCNQELVRATNDIRRQIDKTTQTKEKH